jgi:hypothetical protein
VRTQQQGEAGGLALLQAMCTKNDTCLDLNSKLFSADAQVAPTKTLLAGVIISHLSFVCFGVFVMMI